VCYRKPTGESGSPNGYEYGFLILRDAVYRLRSLILPEWLNFLKFKEWKAPQE